MKFFIHSLKNKISANIKIFDVLVLTLLLTKSDKSLTFCVTVKWLHYFSLQDPESADARAFTKVASKIDDIPFAITSNADVFKEHGLEKDGILLYKKVNFS